MDLNVLFIRGKEAADTGNYDYAIAIFLDILKVDPTHEKTRRALRGCELARFQEKGAGFGARLVAFFKGFGSLIKAFLPGMKPDKVADACERYLARDPASIPVLRRLGSAYQRMGHLDAAVDTLEFARQRKPENLSVLRQLGELSREKGDYEKAVKCFHEIVRIKPSRRDAEQRAKDIAAEMHVHRSHLSEAKGYREVLRDEEGAKGLEDEQRIARSEEEKDARVAAQQKKLDENPEDPIALRDLGQALYDAERFDEAEKVFAKEFEISKQYNARERLGNARLRRLMKAERAAKEAADESGQAPALAAKAEKLHKDRMDFAIKEFEFRRQQHPTDMRLAFQLGNYYFERGEEEDIEKAIQQFQQAVNAPGLKLQAKLMLARCFAQTPQTLDMAKDQLVGALDEVEDIGMEIGKKLTYELARVQEEMGETAEAAKHYKEIYAKDAAYRDVAKKIRELS